MGLGRSRSGHEAILATIMAALAGDLGQAGIVSRKRRRVLPVPKPIRR
jgi:hypothetical protein